MRENIEEMQQMNPSRRLPLEGEEPKSSLTERTAGAHEPAEQRGQYARQK
jgi:hypothetical protein